MVIVSIYEAAYYHGALDKRHQEMKHHDRYDSTRREWRWK